MARRTTKVHDGDCSAARRRRRLRLFGAAIGLTCAAVTAGPGPDKAEHAESKDARLHFVAGGGSSVRLTGTTDISSWTSSSDDVVANVLLGTDLKSINELFDRAETAGREGESMPDLRLRTVGDRVATLSVAVKSLQGDSKGMTRDLHHALKADKHPEIKFKFEQVQDARAEYDAKTKAVNLHLSLIGKLTVAGVTRTMSMRVDVRRKSCKEFVADTQLDLLMSDFGVTPPTALFGLIQASDHVHVSFHLVLARAAKKGPDQGQQTVLRPSDESDPAGPGQGGDQTDN